MDYNGNTYSTRIKYNIIKKSNTIYKVNIIIIPKIIDNKPRAAATINIKYKQFCNYHEYKLYVE